MFQVKWNALQTVTPGTSGTPGVISRDSEWTIAVCSTPSDGSHVYVQLPSGCAIGDVVEIHDASEMCQAVAPAGESLMAASAVRHFWRKIDSTTWGFLA
jgi:hypothetical protein